MFLKSDGILLKFPFFQGNVGKIYVSGVINTWKTFPNVATENFRKVYPFDGVFFTPGT